MKRSYLLGGFVILFFGLLEIVKDHYSTLGFVLITLGVMILFIQIFKWSASRLDNHDSDFYIDHSEPGLFDGDAGGDGGD